MKFGLAAATLALAVGGLAAQANAAVIISGVTPSTVAPANGLMSTVPGVTTIDFNNGLKPGFTGGLVTGASVANQYAAPNGDTSLFFAVGGSPTFTGTATFTPGATYNYFGLYWGSIDAYNTISFSLGGLAQGTFTGSAVPPANGSMTAANTNEYVNFTGAYDTVTFTTTSANFEIDNVAFGNVAVPEPASVALLGAGLLGVAGLVRRKKRGAEFGAAA